MATAAQIEANRKNACMSTGPRTDQGKSSSRANALKHGQRARTINIVPVLPQEDPRELEARTRQWVEDMKPRNAAEHELVCRAARLAWNIDRGERLETAHLTRRVQQATEPGSTRRLKRVCTLGRRLLYMVGVENKSYPYRPWDDEPAVLLHQLEETPEGCRWLLERWAEYRGLLKSRTSWDAPIMCRFVRLMGKVTTEANYDLELNAVFTAWDIAPDFGLGTFLQFKHNATMPAKDPMHNDDMRLHSIVQRPKKAAEAVAWAWAILDGVVNEHVARLEGLLVEREARAAEMAAANAERAAFDCSAEFERHRRYQSARTRELLRTLDTLMKMREAEFGKVGCGEMRNEDQESGMRNGEGAVASGQWPVVSEDKCQMADGRKPDGRRANGQWRVKANARWQKATARRR